MPDSISSDDESLRGEHWPGNRFRSTMRDSRTNEASWRGRVKDAERKSRKRRALADVRKVQEILRHWDPWRLLPGEMVPRDEYDACALPIVSMWARGCSEDSLTAHLANLRTSGIDGDTESASDSAIAAAIFAVLGTPTD